MRVRCACLASYRSLAGRRLEPEYSSGDGCFVVFATADPPERVLRLDALSGGLDFRSHAEDARGSTGDSPGSETPKYGRDWKVKPRARNVQP